MMTCICLLRQHGPIGLVPEQVAISTVGISCRRCTEVLDYPTDEVAVWNNGWGGGYYFLSKADFSQCVYYASGTLSDENPNHFPKVSEISYFTNVIGTLEKASTEVVSEERKREFIAEARLCRGLMMYYLLHVYGPVPLMSIRTT